MSIIKDLKSQIASIQQQIESIQSICSHPPVCVQKIAKSGSSDGYSTDRYWYNCYCGLCEKTWSEDQ